MKEYLCESCRKPCGTLTAAEAVRILGAFLVFRHADDLVSDCCGGKLEAIGYCRDGGDLDDIPEDWRREAALGYLDRQAADRERHGARVVA